MGLLDILNGMQNGPHGQPQPSSGKSGGMSPIMMALLGLLAYKAVKGMGGTSQPAPSMPTSTGSGGLGDILGGLFGGRPSGGMPAPGAGTGGLGNLLPGGLGGLLSGAAAGSVVSGGLGNLVKQMQDNGYGKQAQSWVGTGQNEAIAPDDLANALGRDTIDTLSQQTGMERDELLSGLSQHLPQLVDQLTPEGRLPTEEEASELA